MTSTTSTTPTPHLTTGLGYAPSLGADLATIASATVKASARMPDVIRSAWADADAWAVGVAEATTPTGSALDVLIDAASTGADPYADPAAARALLAATVNSRARVERIDQRAAERKWATFAAHTDALVDAWRQVVDAADATLTRAAEVIKHDDLADSVAMSRLGGSALGAWGAAREAADRLVHLERAYRTTATLLGCRTVVSVHRAPVWLAPLEDDRLDAWDERPRAYRVPGGGDQPWAAPWWLARHGIRLDLAGLDEIGARVRAADALYARRVRAAEADKQAFLRDGMQPAERARRARVVD